LGTFPSLSLHNRRAPNANALIEQEKNMDKKSKDLNLLILYQNSWQEESKKDPNDMVTRAWKNYPFDILNELERENLIRQYEKSVIITKEGQAKIQALLQQYFRI
jgi:hypothetical protein